MTKTVTLRVERKHAHVAEIYPLAPNRLNVMADIAWAFNVIENNVSSMVYTDLDPWVSHYTVVVPAETAAREIALGRYPFTVIED